MHGDDVASAGVQMATQLAPLAADALKGTAKMIADIIMAIKHAIDKKGQELHGEMKMLSSLRKGGEMCNVTLSKEDFELFKQANKEQFKNDIAYYAAPKGKDNGFVELYYLKTDDAAVKGIMDTIVTDKLNKPEQAYKMTMLEKDSAEAFGEYCAENGIPVNLLETEKGEIKCIYSAADELKIKTATEKMSDTLNELKNTSIEVKKDDKGKPKFYISDIEQNKSISVKFGEKEKLQRVLKEQFGYSNVKAVAAANILTGKLTDEQKRFYLSGTKLTEQVDKYEKNIRFEKESVVVSDFTFSKIKLKSAPDTKLLITDKDGSYAVISENIKDRKAVEDILKNNLKVENTEQMNALLAKTERIGYANPAESIKQGEYNISRLSKNGAEVSLGEHSVVIDISNRTTAKNTLVSEFGMTEKKAEKIIDKAKKQSVTRGLVTKAKGAAEKVQPMIQNKNIARGSRK
ncbi:MAG: hypothetical protein NC120_10195 [Ruminococcus sp.]|nr:hypothetical protein [Ruminococcus sp.]